MWRSHAETRNGLSGWAVHHDDGRCGLEWTNEKWLADDVASRLNNPKE